MGVGANLKVSVSPDGKTAWLNGGPLRGLSEAEIRRLLAKRIKQAGVCHGLDREAVHQAIAALQRGELLTRRVIARATPPTPGRDGRVEPLVEMDYRIVGREYEDGHIDFRDRGDLPVVEEGQGVARLIPPQEGVPGSTVTGKAIKPPRPRPGRMFSGLNTRRVEDTLIALKSGHVVTMEPGRFSVMDVITLANVDYETGHIKHPGLVRVVGAIQPGFRVECAALMARTIESGAEVKAKETIMVYGGIMGARVEAGGNVQAYLARRAEIVSGGDVLVRTEVIDSVVRAEGRVEVTTAQGRIINSDVAAGLGVVAAQVSCSGKKSCRIALGPTPKTPRPRDERQPGRARLKVTIRASRKVIIEGYKSKLVLDRNVNAFSAREVELPDPRTGRKKWSIAITEVGRIQPTASLRTAATEPNPDTGP